MARWGIGRYLLLSPSEPTLPWVPGSSRPRVAALADCLLAIRDELQNIRLKEEGLGCTVAAGVGFGTVYTKHQSGRFLAGVEGKAYEVAMKLCGMSKDWGLGRRGGAMMV